jgi:hypothetical protein
VAEGGPDVLELVSADARRDVEADPAVGRHLPVIGPVISGADAVAASAHLRRGPRPWSAPPAAGTSAVGAITRKNPEIVLLSARGQSTGYPGDRQMQSRRRAFLLFGTVAAARSARAARARVGEVSSVTGAATALFSGDPPRPLSLASPVLMEDVLATEASARLACRLEGGLVLRLGSGARLRIDSAVLAGPQAGLVLRDLGVGGPLLIDRPPAPGAVPISVVLPWARIGVRGTRVWGGVMDGVGAVFVERGRATVEAAGVRVTLAAGEGVDIPLQPFGPPDLAVRRWGQARIARALGLVE